MPQWNANPDNNQQGYIEILSGNETTGQGPFRVDQAGNVTANSVKTTNGITSPAAFQPADPSGTVSATLVMMGLGSTCVFTPSVTGKVLVNVTAYHQQATAVSTNQLGCRYGTGVAPSNGAPVTGTRFGAGEDPSIRPPAVGGPCGVAFTDLLSLTVGTPYWFDIALLSGNADSASIKAVSMTFAELP